MFRFFATGYFILVNIKILKFHVRNALECGCECKIEHKVTYTLLSKVSNIK